MKNKIYFTPGPSQLYFTVEEHIKNALKKDILSISHRSKIFKILYQECVENIKILFNLNSNYHIAFTSSANEIWERIIQNLIIKTSIHYVNGSFSKKFFDYTKKYKINSKIIESYYEPYNYNIKYSDEELIAITLNETSTGISCPNDKIKEARLKFKNSLIALDCVSGSPAIPFEIKNVDTFYFSVQKCFGLPSGLGVWVYNNQCIDKCFKKIEKKEIVGSYHSLVKLNELGKKNQTPETPNVLGIYLLKNVINDMLKKGIKNIINETNYKSKIIDYTIKNHNQISHLIKNENIRSKTVKVAKTNKISNNLIKKLIKQNLIIGKGYGKNNYQIRIANFPTHSKENIEMLCDIISKTNF